MTLPIRCLTALAFLFGVVGPASAITYYWDIDGATAGAGGNGAPTGTWSTGTTSWSTDPTGATATSAVTTASTDDLVFSAGTNATGAYTVTLTTTQSAKSLTFEEGTVIISGASGNIALGTGQSMTVGSAASATIGNNTNAIISGTAGLTKTGLGTLTLNGTIANTFTGGVTVSGGTLLLDFANRGAAPQNLVASQALTIGGGGILNVKAAVTNTAQAFSSFTLAAGGGFLVNNPNGTGLIQNVNLAAITATAAGGSLQFTRGTGTGNINTSTANNATGILSARIVNGVSSATGPDWAINSGTAATGTGASGNTIGNYASYTALTTTAGTDTVNSRITAAATLAGARTTNTLKIENPAATLSLALGTNPLTLTAGGLLSTGTNAFTISGTAGTTTLTAGNGSGSFDVIVHQFNTGGLTISAVIGDNGANPVNLVKAGASLLTLTGINTYTGNTYINAGVLDFGTTTPSGTGTNVIIATGSGVKFNSSTIATTLFSRINASSLNNEFTLMPSAGNNVDLSAVGAPANAFLGNYATNGSKFEYAATYTPANNVYKLGSAISAGLFGIGATGGITGSTNLVDNGATPRSLIVGGNRVELVGTGHTFSGTTFLQAGKLTLGNNLALQNSTLDLGASGVGTFALSDGTNAGRITGDVASPSPTFGGIVGTRALASAFSATASNNETLLAATAVTGFTLNVAAGKSPVYSGVIAEFAVGTTITKTGSGTQTLAGVNTFTGGLRILNGTLAATTSAQALGAATNVVTLGDTTGTNNATLSLSTALTWAQPIVVASGSSGTKTIQAGANATTLSGGMTLNDNLTISITGTQNLNSSTTAITGSKDIVINSSGTGIWVPQFQHTYSGTTHLVAGITVSNVDSTGSASTANLTSGPYGTGTLSFEGGSMRPTTGATGNVIGNAVSVAADITFTPSNANTLTFNGPVTLAGTGTNRTLTYVQTGGTVAFSGNIGDAGGGNGIIVGSATTATFQFSGTNTYTGATAINGGTMTLTGTGSVNGTSGITINGTTAKLLQNSTTAIAPTVTLTQGTLTGNGTVNTVNVGAGTGGILSNNNGAAGASLTIGTLTFAGAATVNTFSNSTSAPILTTSLASNAAGPVTINASAPSWTSGLTYNLISYGGGSIGGAGFGQFALGTVTGLLGRQAVGTFADSGTAITLTITGDSPLWTGLDSGNWQLGTTGANENWKLLTAGTPTTFLAADLVLFDDTATGTTAVTINAASVAPTSTTFNNSTLNYSLSGSFGISSGTLTKNGTGTLTIGTANTYAGATTINAGTIILSGTGTLGTGSALILAGGSLDLGTTSQTVGTVSITTPAASGNTIGNGSLTGTSYAASNTTGNAVISANLLLNGTAGFTKTGAGTVTLSGTNTYTGNTTISGGTVKFSGTGTLAASSVAIDTGALLDLNGTNQTLKFVAGSGGTTATAGVVANNSGSGTSVLTLNVTGGVGTAQNVVIQDFTTTSGGKVAVVITANTQPLNNANTYSGGTTVNAGAFLYLTSANPNGAGTGVINLPTLGAGGSTSSGIVVDGVTYANDISGAGYVHNNSNAGATTVTTTFTGNINSSGPFIFRAGTGIVYNFAGNGTTSVLSGVIGSTTSMVNGAVATGKVTKSGTGTLTLSGTNIYTLGTTLSGGTLIANNATTPLGTSASPLTISGGTLDLQTIGTAYNTTVSGNAVIQSDNATSGAGTNKTLGTLSIGAFQLDIAPGANATGSTAAVTFGNTTLTGNATANVAANSTLNLNGTVGGAFSLTVSGGGNVVFGSATTGALSFSGGLIVNAGGTASITTNNLIAGTIPVTVNGTLTNGGGEIFGVLNGSGTINQTANNMFTSSSVNGSFSGTITGAGGYVKDGVSTQILTGLSTYTGQPLILGGVLSVNTIKDFGQSSALGAAASGAIVIGNIANSATLLYTGGAQSTNRTIRIGVNSTTPAATDTGGAIIQNDGSGTLTFNATGFNIPTNAATGVGANRTLTLQGSGNGAIQGVIQDNLVSGTATGTATVALTKAGAGTWTLSAINTYTGSTSINAGELRVATGGSIGSSTASVAVASGATLSGTGTVVGPVTVQIGGTLLGGSSTGTGTLTFGVATPASTSVISGGTGSTGATLATYLDVTSGTINGNGQIAIGANTLNFDASTNKFNIKLLNDGGLTPTQPYSVVLATSTAGTFNRNGTPYDAGTNAFNSLTDFTLISGSGLQTYDPSAYSLSVSSNNLMLNFTPSAVPEPAAALGLASAGLVLAGWVRRRRNSNA